LKKASYLPVTWASNISALLRGDHLVVTGKVPLSDSDIENRRDPYLRYVTSVKSQFAQQQTGRNSPHIRFANAVDDVSLTALVRDFGPVVPSEVSIQKPPNTDISWHEQERAHRLSTIAAVQPLATLRMEQRTYSAALRLMIELKRGKDKSDANAILQHVSEIEEGVWYWPDQYEAERVWREEQYLPPPSWTFNAAERSSFAMSKYDVERRMQYKKAFRAKREAYPDVDSHLTAFANQVLIYARRTRIHEVGHSVLCSLINTFRTEVQFLHHSPVEALSLFSLRFGIRPALYVILRNEYLGRGGAIICGNDRCGEFFVSERAGQRYCSADCSRQYRQRQYWSRTGARKRKRRRAKEKSRTKVVHASVISSEGKPEPKRARIPRTGP
jgi:hypothetical protein